jgi:predicted ATPase
MKKIPRYFIVFYSGFSVTDQHNGYIGISTIESKYVNCDEVTDEILESHTELVRAGITNIIELTKSEYEEFFKRKTNNDFLNQI